MTITSKLKDIERYNREIVNTNKKISDFESKLVRKSACGMVQKELTVKNERVSCFMWLAR